MTTRYARIAALLAAGVLGLTACGSGDDEPKAAETTASAAQRLRAAQVADGLRTPRSSR